MLALLALGCAACSRSSSSSEDPALASAIADLENAVAAARTQVQRLKDVDDLENLANIYGHYVDKSRHDDVADLFAPTGVVEILGRGVFIGETRVREYMRNLSPGAVGPRDGALFNHMPLQPVIDVSPDGKTAYTRTRLFVMFGIANAANPERSSAQWGDGVYENVAVKEDGIWKLKYLHVYQTFYTNFEDGWAKKASAIFAPYDRLPPDQPQSVAYDPYPAAFAPPFHYRNPVSGRADHYADPEFRGAQAQR